MQATGLRGLRAIIKVLPQRLAEFLQVP